MSALRIGTVMYLNTQPLVEGLRAWAAVELVAAAPSRLLGLLERAEVDLALVSLIDAARSTVPLTLLPCGMIGSDGPTLTVRLYSRVPLREIRCVGVDTDTHTSAVLMRVLLASRFGTHPTLIDYDAREHVVVGAGDAAPIDAILLIGDKVVTDHPPENEFPYSLDLGEAWREWTGLPFVYAVWMCRRGDETSPVISAAAAVLERARLRNRMRLDWIVGKRAVEHRWSSDDAAEYLGRRLTYEVGERERAAVSRFLAEAKRINCIDSDLVHWAELGEFAA